MNILDAQTHFEQDSLLGERAGYFEQGVLTPFWGAEGQCHLVVRDSLRRHSLEIHEELVWTGLGLFRWLKKCNTQGTNH